MAKGSLSRSGVLAEASLRQSRNRWVIGVLLFVLIGKFSLQAGISNSQTEPTSFQATLLGASVTETTLNLLFRLQGTNIAQTLLTINGLEIWDLTTADLLFSAYEGIDEFIWNAHPVSDDEVWVWIEAQGVPEIPLYQDLDIAVFVNGLSPDGQPLWFSVITTPYPGTEPSPEVSPLFLTDLTADTSATIEPTPEPILEPTPETMGMEGKTFEAEMATTQTISQTTIYQSYQPPYTRPQPPFRPPWQPPPVTPPLPRPPYPPPSPSPPLVDESWFSYLELGAPMPWEGWDVASPFSLVNMTTGNVFTVIPITGFLGKGFTVSFNLYHNSAKPPNLISGGLWRPTLPSPGWTHSFSAYISPVPDYGIYCRQIERIYLITDTGRILPFQVIHSGSGNCTEHQFIPSPGVFVQLKQKPDGTFILTRKDHVTLTFRCQNLVNSRMAIARLSEIAEPNGNKIELIYDQYGRLTEIRESSGRKLLLSYDNASRLVSVTDPRQDIYLFLYDSYGRLRDILKHPPVSCTQIPYITFTYPPADSPNRHVLLTVTDERRFNWSYYYHNLYDSRGAIITQVNHPGTTSKKYVWAKGYSDVTDQDNVTIRYTRNSSGELSAVSLDPNGRNLTVTFTYSPFRCATIVTTPRGKVWRFSFDQQWGNLLSVTDPLGKVTTFTYDSRNNLTSITDPKGHKVQIAYDDKDNPIRITDPAGKVWNFSYGGWGNLVSESDPQGHRWQYLYNTQGDVIAVIDPLGNRYNLGYDASGFLSSVTDPLNRTWRISRGNNILREGLTQVVRWVVTLTHPDGKSRVWVYDHTGNLLRFIDENGKQVSFNYNEQGLLTSVTDPMGRTTTFSYTPAGRLSTITNALGRSISYTYESGTGRLQRVNFPDGTSRSATYLPDGLIATITDGRGRTVSFNYDDVGRLVRINLPNGTSINYAYDEDGLLTSVTDPTGTTSFSYDARHLLIEERNPRLGSQSLRYIYDDCGNLTALMKGNETLASYNWDELHRLTQVNHSRFGITKFFYDAVSRLTRVENSNGTVTQYDYTVRDFVRKIAHYKSDGTLLAGWVREIFDDVGQVLRERELHRSRYTDFFYNDAYELTRYTVRRIVGAIDTRGSYTDDQALLDESFTYDSVGNRLSKKDNITNATINYTYDAFNKLTRVGDHGFEYDSNGNLIRRYHIPSQTTLWQYEWNDLDELVKVIRYDGQTTRFFYDGLGRRVRKEGPNGVFTYLHDGFQVLSDGVVEYGWAGSRLIGERWTTGTMPKFWHLTDGRASTRLLIDANQQVAATLDYKAFGELWQSSGDALVPFPTTRRFVSHGGYEYELESGLYHIGYRYYDPEIGRFLSIDPIGFGINWYVYALNDPINSFESFGLEPKRYEHYGIEYTSPGLPRRLFLLIDRWFYGKTGIEPEDTTQERFLKAAPVVTEIGVRVYFSTLPSARTVTIYEIRDKSGTLYVGRTVDLARRGYEHMRSGMLKPGRHMDAIVRGVPDKLKAAVEEILIQVSKPILNKRAALSKRRKDYRELIEEALRWLRRKGYDNIVEQFRATNIVSH